MAKKIVAVVRPARSGRRHAAPPVDGPALGPHGIQTMEFCKQYNAATESMKGTVIPVDITIYDDRSFLVHLEDPTDAGAVAPGRGVRKARTSRAVKSWPR